MYTYHQFLISLAIFVDKIISAEQDQAIGGTPTVLFDPLPGIGDRLLNGHLVNLVLHVRGLTDLVGKHVRHVVQPLLRRNVD